MNAFTDTVAQIILETRNPIVLIDYFDTLVTRKVTPEYTKWLASRHVVQRLGLSISPAEMYEARNKAESDICKRNHEGGHDQEFRFTELVRVLSHRLGIQGERNLLLNIFGDCEITAELYSQILDPSALDLLTELKKQGRRIFVISDFYLGKSLLDQCLMKHGLQKYIERAFVSSDYLRTKRSGRLFPIVLSEIRAAPSECLMIGDNPESDVRQPRELGINAVGIDRSITHSQYNHQFAVLKSAAVARQEVRQLLSVTGERSKGKDRFNLLAATFYLFAERLDRHSSRESFSTLLFLSREGEFLKKLFDKYLEYQPKTINTPKTKYFIASRKSTFLPALRDLANEDFLTLFRQYQRISSRDFVRNLNLGEETLSSLAAELGCSFDERQDWYSTSEPHARLMESERFRSAYERIREEQRKALSKYLDELVGRDRKRIALVDVGWKGTIQDHLYLFDRGMVEYNGLYLGLVANGHIGENNLKSGLLFDLKNPESKAYTVFNENRALFEIALGASHGSANRYLIDDQGNPQPDLDPFELERPLFESRIAPLQERIFSTFTKICEALSGTHLRMEDVEYEVLSTHANLVFNPNECELKYFRELFHLENFGQLGVSTFNSEARLPLKSRLQLAKRIYSGDFSMLANSWWPPLTLANLGLRSMIPSYAKERRRVWDSRP